MSTKYDFTADGSHVQEVLPPCFVRGTMSGSTSPDAHLVVIEG